MLFRILSYIITWFKNKHSPAVTQATYQHGNPWHKMILMGSRLRYVWLCPIPLSKITYITPPEISISISTFSTLILRLTMPGKLNNSCVDIQSCMQHDWVNTKSYQIFENDSLNLNLSLTGKKKTVHGPKKRLFLEAELCFCMPFWFLLLEHAFPVGIILTQKINICFED